MELLQILHRDCFCLLETKRLILRPFTMDDAPDMFAYTSAPENCRYLKWDAHTHLAQAENFLAGVMERYQNHTDFIWGITLHETGHLIGTCRLFDIHLDDGRGEVSYMMNPEVQGNGYASEAVCSVIAYAFDILELTRIQARCVAENRASERVMQKSGMQMEGVLRHYSNMHGKPCDFKLYAIVRDGVEEETT